MDIEKRLQELNIKLPEAAKTVFDYIPVTVWQNVAYISGQLPKVNNTVLVRGKVPDEVTLEQAQESARICVLQGLACLKQAIGDLNKVERILKVAGFVNSSVGFDRQPKVINAASILLREIFGEKGRHARSAIGVAELPRRSPVEIEFIVALKP